MLEQKEILYDGKLPICIITTRMNSTNYIELLEDVLIQHLEENVNENLIFQQDNASIHVSKQTKAWFAENNVPVMDWPACSPDLNPIENLWGLLASEVYKHGRQFNTISDLKDCIKDSWRKIGRSTLQTLINSMPERIFEVIKAKGGPTKY